MNHLQSSMAPSTCSSWACERAICSECPSSMRVSEFRFFDIFLRRKKISRVWRHHHLARIIIDCAAFCFQRANNYSRLDPSLILSLFHTLSPLIHAIYHEMKVDFLGKPLTDPPVALAGLLLTPAHPGTVFFSCLISSRPPPPGDPRAAPDVDDPAAVPPPRAAPPGFCVARNFFHCCKPIRRG